MAEQTSLRLLGQVAQWGYVIPDIEAAMQHWSTVFGVGPWIYVENVTAGWSYTHRGTPTHPELRVAFSYFGETQIELIEQVNAAPTPYTEFRAAGRQGLQHLAMWAADYPAAVARVRAAGYQPIYAMTAEGQPNPTIYYAAPDLMGTMLELGEASPRRMAAYAAMRRLAEQWDGTTPIRRYASMLQFNAEQGVA